MSAPNTRCDSSALSADSAAENHATYSLSNVAAGAKHGEEHLLNHSQHRFYERRAQSLSEHLSGERL